MKQVTVIYVPVSYFAQFSVMSLILATATEQLTMIQHVGGLQSLVQGYLKVFSGKWPFG